MKPTRMLRPSAAIAKMPIWIRDAEPVVAEDQRREADQRRCRGSQTLRLVVVGKIVVSAA